VTTKDDDVKAPPEPEYDVYDPSYVPPPADPAHDAVAADVPPGELYSPPQQYDAAAAPPPSGMDYSIGAASTDVPYGVPTDADAALQSAVGAPSPRARKRAQTEATDDGTPVRSKRTMLIAIGSIVVGLGIASLVFLGHASSQRYGITCDASRAIPIQGRAFPPWGTHALNGPEWAPIALPRNAECQPRETEDPAELGKWYLELLLDRATVTLTQKDLLDVVIAPGQPPVSPLDAVSTELDQALLLARDPDRRDQRKEITRLQGDVQYWRAALRLRDASTVLADAAKQFDAANQQHPRHATDAAAWSTFLHHLADELRAGPNGAPIIGPAGVLVTPTTTSPGIPVPVGTALPVEEGSGAETPIAPDAGVPSGGVLL
jgi:hypothetical protein